MRDWEKDLESLSIFMPYVQWNILRKNAITSEESDSFCDLIEKWAQRIEDMPKTYEQDGKGDDAIAHLHYFYGASDWYITEKDKSGKGTEQAFGFTILNGDLQMAELGYISIDEIVEQSVIEFDLYWTPKTIGDIKREKGL
jgi:hypothetical protein